MKYALTVTLNAAVDTTYLFDGFAVGAIHSVREMHRAAGGKGNNVARVLKLLGLPVVATGFAGGHAGAFIEEELRRLSIDAQFEPIAGESRTCLALVDRQGQSLTEVREQGPTISPAAAGAFRARFARLLAGAGAVVLSGSLPPGLAVSFYQELVAMARRAGVYTVLDSSSAPLREALVARPSLVKPNREELAAWVGSAPESPQAILAAAAQMRQAGAEAVAVSLGAAGLVYTGPEGTHRLVPPPVEVVNPVGSGDSLVAGLVAGRLRGLPLLDSLRLGVACGTANAMTRAIASPDPAEVERLWSQVQVCT